MTTRILWITGFLAVLVPGVAGLAPAAAQEQFTFSVSALGGLGGSTDANPGDDLSNTALQLNLALITEPKTHLGLRIGTIDLSGNEQFGSLFDAQLDYVNISGEYRYNHTFYQSGLFIGIGGYRLDGKRVLDSRSESETSFGLVLGLTGEFELTRRLGFVIELAGHYTDLEDAQIFATGHAGIVFHF